MQNGWFTAPAGKRKSTFWMQKRMEFTIEPVWLAAGASRTSSFSTQVSAAMKSVDICFPLRDIPTMQRAYEQWCRRRASAFGMLLPAFLSWTVVSAALLIFLHPDSGIVNAVLEALGGKPINWYMQKQYWPYLILFCMMYKDAGMSSIYFYSALLSIDNELFDAANLDGANRLQQILHISIPAMSKVFCITLITQMGTILASGVSPFYELTFNNGSLYDTTQVLGTYLYNGLGGGRYSFLTAVSLIQSLIGLVLVLASNTIVKRVDPDSAMF